MMLRVEGVSKSYRKTQGLDHVSCQFEPGKFISIIGPNGAGKSTLLSVVAQLLPHDEGNVSLDGQSLADWKQKDLAKRLSFLRQANQLNIKLTVRELVAFGRFPYCGGNLGAEDEAAVDRALNYLELNDIAHKFIDEISGGQRQLAFIAMTLAQDTDYILLDEPLNNLDMKHSVQIMKALRHMVDHLGKTVLIVIHDINFASYYADEIVALKKGQLVVHGTTEEVIQEGLLGDLYNMPIHVRRQGDKLLCDYFG